MDILVYPNPAKDKVMISSKERMREVLLYDLYGKLIVEKFVNSQQGILLLPTLVRQLYFLKIIFENNQVYLSKVVIE